MSPSRICVCIFSRSLPALMKFVVVGPSLHLDGFVFELPGDEFGKDVNSFGRGIRRILKCISDHDPAGFHCMNKSYLSKVGWSFEFDGVPIFVTTFAPCYPETHSRYAFGAQHAFVLLQPMYSFAIHDNGEDTPHTNWECPITVRDKIRVAYKESGRPYYIRDTIVYPAAHDIVKPLKEGVGDLVRWWRDPSKEDQGEGQGELEKLLKELERTESGEEGNSDNEEEESEGEPEAESTGIDPVEKKSQ